MKAFAGSLDAALAILKTLEEEEALRWVQGNLTRIVKKIEENLILIKTSSLRSS